MLKFWQWLSLVSGIINDYVPFYIFLNFPNFLMFYIFNSQDPQMFAKNKVQKI